MDSTRITDALTFALMLHRQEGGFAYSDGKALWGICHRCVRDCGITTGEAWQWWERSGFALVWRPLVLECCLNCVRKRA
jgi:hypothetical protein